ncbi:MAG: T9SS type A sorting domain-containing protein [Candidatus Hatepunaea meridiana]|nr:T9SS type A sorting domain-containing protein [Candidatus Hatepunaea meridiana]
MILLITISILLLQLTAYGQDSLSIQPVGEIRGHKVLFVSGDRMLVEDLEEYPGEELYQNEIVLWDIANPAEPEELHRCLTMNTYWDVRGYSQGFCSDAILRDTLIFAMLTAKSQFEGNCSIGPTDLVIYDITNQDTLWHQSFERYQYHFMDPHGREQVAVPAGLLVLSDDYLYVASGMDGIFIYDVSDLENVEEVANLGFKSDNLVLYDDLLIFTYLPPGTRQDDLDIYLSKFDVSDPTNPEELGEVSLNHDNYWWYWSDIELSIWGNYLYLFPFLYLQQQQVGFIEIYDISGDEEPKLVRRIEADFMERSGRSVISEGKLFFKDPYSIRVFDLADPLNPELIYLTGDPTGYYIQISTYEDFIYIAPGSIDPRRDPWENVDTVRILRFGVTAVNELTDQNLPGNFGLYPAYPNPFNSTTMLTYCLPYSSHISLQLYDLSGRRIATLFKGFQQPGILTTTLTATDLPSGLYFVRLEASGEIFSQKVMLIR